MAYKVVDTIRRALRDMAEKRRPNIRYIDGQPYAYCAVRKEWRKVRFHGEK